MITELRATYNNKEVGYTTPIIRLTGDVVLHARLKKRGRICIKKSNTGKGRWPKVMVTPQAGPEFRITIYGETKGKYIQVVTSEAPVYIRTYNV